MRRQLVFRRSLFLHEETYTRDTTYFDADQLLSGGMLCMLSRRTENRVYSYIRLSIERTQVAKTHAATFNPYPNNTHLSLRLLVRKRNFRSVLRQRRSMLQVDSPKTII